MALEPGPEGVVRRTGCLPILAVLEGAYLHRPLPRPGDAGRAHLTSVFTEVGLPGGASE